MTSADNLISMTSRLRSCMSRCLLDSHDNWHAAFDKIRDVYKIVVKQHVEAMEKMDDTFNNRILAKAGLLSIEADFKVGYIEGIECFNDAVHSVVGCMDRTHQENAGFNAFELHREVISRFMTKHSKFLTWYDRKGRLKATFQKAVMEAISFCEDFKTFWMEFFSSNQYYDLVDVGEQHMEEFNRIVFAKAQESLKSYRTLNGILSCVTFEKSLLEYRRFSMRIGKLIFVYYCEIGTATQEKLKHMNDCIKDSKFITTHIVVAAVARLRYILKEENLLKYNHISFLKFVEASVVQNFWKQAVLNFDKDFRKAKEPNLNVFHDTVQSLYMVERESDGKRGVLVYLKDTFDRFMIYKDDNKRLHLNNVQNVSNR